MGLSVLQIEEEDCGTGRYLPLTIINEKHIQTLIGKWFKYKPSDTNWILYDGSQKLKPEQDICLRSPIYCTTPDKKICRKCFGEKEFNTKYLGILAGQILSERLI